MLPRDVVKKAFQFHEGAEVPFCLSILPEHEEKLTGYYGSEAWRNKVKPYIQRITACDHLMSLSPPISLPGGLVKDLFGIAWKIGSIDKIVEPPLKEPSLACYQFPDVGRYYDEFVVPRWETELAETKDGFRIGEHVFGLFERSWSLRGFECFLMDLADNSAFCEELIENVANWIAGSIERLLEAPLDALFFTDDYADQRGMIFGLERFRRLFRPHWRRLFDIVHRAGVYTILHVCGNAEPALADLIDCGLDCLESLQPEAMDIYGLKKKYGKDLRLWGGLGVQRISPFGTAEAVKREVKHLKLELGREGGFILGTAKPFHAAVPIENIVAYLEEASASRF
jgi:uroporphyrinogen decarboxylase